MVALFFFFWGTSILFFIVKVAHLCLTLCDPMDCSPSGSSDYRIFQGRILEHVAISFSNAWKWKVKVKSLSRVWLLATPWTVAYQASLSLGFARQEYWSGLPLPSLHGLYNPWNYLGQNTREGCLSLLQGIFLTQGSNSGLLHCRQICYLLSHKGEDKDLNLNNNHACSCLCAFSDILP